MDTLNLKLTDFDGPLDLLLTLINENKMDIENIDLLAIADQYLKFVYAQRNLEINEASEYLYIASKLVWIKSKSILSNTISLSEQEQNLIDEEKQKLINQILIYKKYRDLVNKLQTKYDDRSLMHSKLSDNIESTLNINVDKTIYTIPNQINFESLRKCYLNVYEKWRLNIFNNHKIVVQEVSAEQVEQDIVHIINKNKQIKKYAISDFFTLIDQTVISKQYLVTCFVCLLDLAKNGVIELKQETLNDEIYIHVK